MFTKFCDISSHNAFTIGRTVTSNDCIRNHICNNSNEVFHLGYAACFLQTSGFTKNVAHQDVEIK